MKGSYYFGFVRISPNKGAEPLRRVLRRRTSAKSSPKSAKTTDGAMWLDLFVFRLTSGAKYARTEYIPT